MKTENERNLDRFALFMVKVLSVALMTGIFAATWYVFYGDLAGFFRRGNWVVILIFAVIYILYGRVYDVFTISYSRLAERVFSQALALFFTNAVLWLLGYLVIRHPPAIIPLLISYGIEILVSFLWCVLSKTWYFRVFPPKKSLVVWEEDEGILQLIKDYGLSAKFEIEKTIKPEECFLDPAHRKDEKTSSLKITKETDIVMQEGLLEGIEAVFLGSMDETGRNAILKACAERKIQVFAIPRIGDVLLSGAGKLHLFHLPFLRVKPYDPSLEYLFIKRFLDIVLSALALVLTSPLMLVTAIIIKAEDHGPVFYRQNRLTRNGRVFTILKFRSMRTDAESDGKAVLSSGTTDDRVTRIGRFIRRSRIDELPQLLNILKGDMTIVGPRPERPEIFEEYLKELPEFALRLQAKAGLTGYAQVYGKYNTTPYDKLLMDLMYLAKLSFAEDVKIVFATLKILASKISTEGVKEKQGDLGED